MKMLTIRLLLCTTTAAIMQSSYADTTIELVNRENDRIQQNIQDRLRYEQEQLLQSDRIGTRIEIAESEKKQTEKGPCISISKIIVEGVTALSKKTIDHIIQPYQGQCIDSQSIELIMTNLTAAYLSQGYATTRIYLPEQDLKSGVLRLNVEEGKLAELRLTDAAKGTISLKTAIIAAEGKLLNLRDLEQALDQINRLQSNHASMNIYPGNNAGESIVEFNNQQRKRLNGYFVYDNHGQDATGRNQAALGLSLDNPLGLNDLINISYNRSLPFKHDRQDSYAASAFYAVPLGYQTVSLSASRSEYDSMVNTQFNQLHSNGKTNTYSGRLDSLLYRGMDNQLRANIALNHKDTQSFLEDLKLDVSSRKLSVLDVGINYSDLLFSGVFNINLGYSRGLDILNALKDPANLAKEMPKAQFEKMIYGLSYFKPFVMRGHDFSISSNFTGQYAFNPLYGSEQYSIGSLYSVRGFNQSSISGDSGYSIKNNLNLNKVYRLNGSPLIAKYYLGFDYGKVENKENSNMVGELSSITLGSGFNIKNMSLELMITQPLHKPNYMQKPDTDFFFATTVTF